ncbi:hypothetical protein ACLI4U_11290 [Natrialbaceae archaeon A-CW2]|uniref:hypothetical protein n=1 Tax=Natronosalvus amylolyticus TaxID=2961994 RepID=UPI0020C97260|nr:hypothetical protein [Natronosalvus amylolyticus]
MGKSVESRETAELVERINQLASDDQSDSDEPPSIERLAFDLVRRCHDRINELYYEYNLSDAEAEARMLKEIGLSVEGIALVMGATRDDISLRKINDYLL